MVGFPHLIVRLVPLVKNLSFPQLSSTIVKDLSNFTSKASFVDHDFLPEYGEATRSWRSLSPIGLLKNLRGCLSGENSITKTK
jgi:hypothetical protein